VVVTDHGEPACVIKLLPAPAKKRPPLPDYYARLRKRQFSRGMRGIYGVQADQSQHDRSNRLPS